LIFCTFSPRLRVWDLQNPEKVSGAVFCF